MKNILIGALILCAAIACNNAGSGKSPEKEKAEKQALELSEFMKLAADSLDKEVFVKGTVNHVCSHSGRRCFIVDTSGNISLRIEAKGEINGFNRELSGMDIEVTGIVREKRLYTDYLNEWEAKVKAKEKDIEQGGEHCSAELQNIQDMRNWMAENNKDYYQVIYLDGMAYNVIYEEEEQN